MPAPRPAGTALRLAAAALAASAGLAASPSQPATPQPGGVIIAVRAVTRDGRPVAGLQPDDVQVLVDGRPAPVSAIVPEAPATMPGPAGPPARRLVVVVNRPTIAVGAGRAVLEQVATFLEQLPASEYAAVWPLPSVRPQLVLTGDRAISRAALVAATGTRTVPTGRFVLPSSEVARIASGDQMLLDVVAERECPQTSGSREEVSRCREDIRRDASLQTEQITADAQRTGRELHLLVGALGRIGGPKHVVVVTAGVAHVQELAGTVRAIAADAAAARVTIHAIQMAQLGGAGVGARGAERSLEIALARATGGLAFASADAQEGLRSLGRELSGEYALAFVPDPAQRDGQVHDLEVKVAKDGVASVSAARQIRLDPPPAAPAVTAAPAATPPMPTAAAAPSAPAEPATRDVAARAAAPADPGLTTMTLQTLLARVADYGRRYEQTMATVVIEERYVQLLKRWGLPPKAADTERLAWLPGAGAPDRLDVQVYQRRQTRADLLLVQLPNQRWAAFRDILEVNGREQRGREDRLRRLFLEQTADGHRQLHRINEASAALNLGRFYREINVPTVGLMILQAGRQPRFSFKAGSVDRVGDVACRQISFAETTKPTLVRTLEEKDVPLAGSACVDADGVVWRTRIELEGRVAARGAVEVVYAPHERIDVLVPVRMWEWYLPVQQDESRGPVYIEALATYSNLRQFTVTTSETVK